MQNNSQEFSLYFGKQSHELKAQTLADSLSAFSILLTEINKGLGTGKRLEFKVKTFQPGSFEVPCELIELVIAGLLAPSGSFHIPTILKIAWEMMKLKIDLGGKPALEIRTEGNSTAVVTHSGHVTYVDKRTFKIFQDNPIAVDSMEKQFEALNRDQEVTSFELLSDKREKLIEVPSCNFRVLAEKPQPEDVKLKP